jgi:hypothetical protein
MDSLIVDPAGGRQAGNHTPDLYIITVDLDDGQPCPPFIEDGVPWRVMHRRDGRTLWRRATRVRP